MIECAVIGDSIAVGISRVRPECRSITQVGITSQTWVRRHAWQLGSTRTMIISLGTNDSGINTEAQLRTLRVNADAERVFWVLPSTVKRAAAATAVRQVAAEFGDTVIVPPVSQIASDGIHLTRRGYQTLANQTR